MQLMSRPNNIMQTIIKGDIIRQALNFFEEAEMVDVIICHGCNTLNVMGAGVAKQLRNKWPVVYEVDTQVASRGENKLGNYSFACVEEDVLSSLYVVNMYTQANVGKADVRYVSYDAIDDAFRLLTKQWYPHEAVIFYPMIGAGLGNGHWPVINEIINYRLKNYEHYLVEYE